jgi:transcriptional regulator with XRE-family HTH domain
MPKPRKLSPVQETKELSDLPSRLVSLRKTQGLTQTQLAQAIGVSRDLLANFEKGRTRLTDESIINLSKALNVSADELLGLSVTPTEEPASLRIMRRIKNIEKLPPAKQKAILQTLDMALQSVTADQVDRA